MHAPQNKKVDLECIEITKFKQECKGLHRNDLDAQKVAKAVTRGKIKDMYSKERSLDKLFPKP